MASTLLVPLLLLPLSDVDGAAPTDAADELAAASTTWTQWRGPNRDGVVGGPEWPDALSKESVKESWTIEGLGESYAAPIVTERFVYTVSTVEKKYEVAQAYDRKTGEKVWETRWEGAMSVPFFAAKNGSWIRSTPVFDGETLYVGGMRDVVVALKGDDGSVLWTSDLPARHETDLPKFGLVCSPLIVGDSLYIQAGASLARLDRKTGETIWRSTAGNNGGTRGGGMDSAFSSPILANVAGRDQLIVQSRSHLAGIDHETGEELWSTAVQAFRGMNILTPQIVGDSIFTSAYGGRAHMYDVTATDDGFEVSEAWTARAQGYMTSPVVVDDHAYLFLRSNRFTCVGLMEGEDGWISEPTGDEYWSLVAQGGRILALANTGILRLIDANPDEYDVAGEVQLVDGPSWAHLAVTAPTDGGDGAEIFVRGQTSLHAFRWK